MPSISIEGSTFKLGYGITAEDIFWCKQGIVQTRELRDSLDEQIVADLVASIISHEPFAVSREMLDRAYTPGDEVHDDLSDKLNIYGSERVAREVKATLGALQAVIDSYSTGQNVFRKLVNPSARSNPVRTPFYAVFMAFHRLVVQESMRPGSPESIMDALRNVAKKLEAGAHHVTSKARVKNVQTVRGLIQDYFVKADPSLLKHRPGLAIDLENSLRRSRIETSRYEFKQGVLSLGAFPKFEPGFINKVVNEACAIANNGPGQTGFVYLGVADNKSDAERIRTLDGVEPVLVDRVWVVGVEREATVLGVTLEEIIQKKVGTLRHVEMSEWLKDSLLNNLDVITYRGLTVLRFTVGSMSEMSWVGKQTYYRVHSNTEEAEGPKIATISNRFR